MHPTPCPLWLRTKCPPTTRYGGSLGAKHIGIFFRAMRTQVQGDTGSSETSGGNSHSTRPSRSRLSAFMSPELTLSKRRPCSSCILSCWTETYMALSTTAAFCPWSTSTSGSRWSRGIRSYGAAVVRYLRRKPLSYTTREKKGQKGVWELTVLQCFGLKSVPAKRPVGSGPGFAG